MQRSRAIIRDSSHRGFTLVELLVAMSIIIILSAVAITGFRSAYEADRVKEAASVLRGAIEGARSRAIRAGDNRGIRLLLDPDDNRMVTSIVYIAPTEQITGYLRYEYDSTDLIGLESKGKWRVFDVTEFVDPTNYVNWRQLYRMGLLRPQCEIQFNGQVYRLESPVPLRPGPQAEDDAWTISAGSELGDGSVPPLPVDLDTTEPGAGIGLHNSMDIINSPRASLPVPYTLTLLPSILEGASPVSLPARTCIDLDGSQVPKRWRPLTTGQPYGPRANNGEVWPMDIMFNKRGVVTNDYITEGFFHFRVADRNDVLAARNNIPALANPTSYPVVVKDPEHPAKVVTLQTHTGMLRITNVHNEESTGSPPVYNTAILSDKPFRNGILGKEAK
jgi:prepilin-type N-terminal cleavage/methylation domain